jgi:hypothetical protein
MRERVVGFVGGACELEDEFDAGDGHEADAGGSERLVGRGEDGDADARGDESEDRDAARFLDDLRAEPGRVARRDGLVVGERGPLPNDRDERARARASSWLSPVRR